MSKQIKLNEIPYTDSKRLVEAERRENNFECGFQENRCPLTHSVDE